MILDLTEFDGPMKIVYKLSDELKKFPERVIAAQRVTLQEFPHSGGLKGTLGLFGSDEWWENVENGGFPTISYSGIVTRVYIAYDNDSQYNDSIVLLLSDGTLRNVGIYVNEDEDADLFRVGCRAAIFYVVDELKLQPAMDGGINYSRIAIEMVVSLNPV